MPPEYNQPMVENEGSFADRFERLRGDTSYEKLSDAIALKCGVRISAQGMHKWVKQGGGITLENAKVVSEYFGVSPSWLLFGEGKPSAIEEVIAQLPDDNPQQTIDFIEYKLQRSEHLIASEKLAHYMKMIEDFRQDIAKLRDKPSEQQ